MTPEPIKTAPPSIDGPPLLLFCPEQGGWHSGLWFYGKWLAYIDSSIVLHPTHWMMAPGDPDEDLRKAVWFESSTFRRPGPRICAPAERF